MIFYWANELINKVFLGFFDDILFRIWQNGLLDSILDDYKDFLNFIKIKFWGRYILNELMLIMTATH